MQPHRTQKVMQPLGKKTNHATSQNTKNHPSSWDKEITQPLGT